MPWLTVAALVCAGCAPEKWTVVAVGDVACDPNDSDFAQAQGQNGRCAMAATSQVAEAQSPDALLMLGDLQYETGSADAFAQSFDVTWGRHKPKMKPAPGNHEYETPGAAGYFGYFGGLAGPDERGYYAFDLGPWRTYSLNSNCDEAGGCGQGSPQWAWLAQDLADHPRRCSLAYFHHPRFSSGLHGDHDQMQAIWALLYQHGVEIVLTGHDHSYERFSPLNDSAEADTAHGIRQFVVGSGGKNHYVRVRFREASEVFDSSSYGVLKLVLRPSAYSWQFVPIDGDAFSDSGTAACHVAR
ncbi:MAG: metallophosphoesterase family protein [Myxococcaceae bacterium]